MSFSYQKRKSRRAPVEKMKIVWEGCRIILLYEEDPVYYCYVNTMLKSTVKEYPLTRQVACKHCGVIRTSTRHGPGNPWRGGLDYWYSVPLCNCSGAIRDREQIARNKEALHLP